MVNNLLIIPAKINGLVIYFLLDTGVKENVLFCLDENKEMPVFDVEKINLKSLGTQESIEELRAFHNVFAIDEVHFDNEEIIMVLDQNFNFLSTLGIAVNGTMEHHLFSHVVVEIDYNNQKMHLKKNRNYKDKFRYNTTGIAIHHA